MTLIVTGTPVGGQYLLGGVARNPSESAPLGRRYFHSGAHWIGFDDNFAEPVIVRAYYDPAEDPAAQIQLRKGLDYIGYMQFMQLAFRGTSIPPDVFGGKLADRKPYLYGKKQRFIDFMGPSDAKLRRLLTPFYPYNAMLVDGTLLEDSQFCATGLANGSLYAPRDYGPQQSVVASLAAQIAPGLATPRDVARLLDDGNLLVVISPAVSEAGKEPYRIALDWLENKLLPDSTSPWLYGLDESTVAAQVIGDYVLLTLPDPENLADTLVVSTRPRPGGGTDVAVHVLREYDIDGMIGSAGRQMLWRIKEYQLATDAMIIDQDDLASDEEPT